MRSRDSKSSNRNPFDLALDEWRALDEQPPNTEAEFAGPWHVAPIDAGWGCIADGETEPTAVFDHRHCALLAAAALPPSGTPGRFTLQDRPEPPFPILDNGKPMGSSAWFQQEFIACLNALATVAASPSGLAYLLESAGATATRRAANILAQRLRQRATR
jgi:hypothetical protein